MAKFRRRRKRYIWLPQLGFQPTNDDSLDSVIIPLTTPTIPADGTPSDVTIAPLIPDLPLEQVLSTDNQLGDYVGNEYILKRIVGRYFCSAGTVSSAGTANLPVCIAWTLGFFIARADGSGNVTSGLPVGTATAADRARNYGPINPQTTREPWIWRRTWLVSPIWQDATTHVRVYGNAAGNGTMWFPNNNLDGSVAEGSHIDAKTARRVSQDDRLWLALQGQAIEVINPSIGGTMSFNNHIFDLRFLGALRRARGRSAF